MITSERFFGENRRSGVFNGSFVRFEGVSVQTLYYGGHVGETKFAKYVS